MTASSQTARPIRVAYVIQNLNYGGMERLVHAMAHHLPDRGFDIHVVVLQYLGRFAEGLDGRATLHEVPPMPRWSFFHPARLRDVFRDIAPDIVHSHSGVWLKSARAAHLAGVPAMVHTEHGRPDPIPLADRLIDRTASRWTDVVIAVSEALAGTLRRQVVRNPSQVQVIPNGVDTDQFRPGGDRAALRDELGLPRDAFVIGSVGRLEPVKHYVLALRALARLDGEPWLALVGDGSERPALEALARELGVASRVRFLGFRPDAHRAYGAFDLFLLPSLSEGTSVSLLEAMASGVCPALTDVGGNRAVLGPDLAGLLVPSGDVAALAALLDGLRRDPARRAQLAEAGRARVEAEFSLHAMLDRHESLYRSLLRR